MLHAAMQPAVDLKEELQTERLKVQKMLSEAMETEMFPLQYLET